MSKLRYFVLMLLVLFFCDTASSHAAESKLKVVATQTMYSEVVKEIGKDKVDVKYVAPPKLCNFSQQWTQ